MNVKARNAAMVLLRVFDGVICSAAQRGALSDLRDALDAPAEAKSHRIHALVNAGHYPGMSEAFDAYMGARTWADPAFRQDAAVWAAAWRAATGVALTSARPSETCAHSSDRGTR